MVWMMTLAMMAIRMRPRGGRGVTENLSVCLAMVFSKAGGRGHAVRAFPNVHLGDLYAAKQLAKMPAGTSKRMPKRQMKSGEILINYGGCGRQACSLPGDGGEEAVARKTEAHAVHKWVRPGLSHTAGNGQALAADVMKRRPERRRFRPYI